MGTYSCGLGWGSFGNIVTCLATPTISLDTGAPIGKDMAETATRRPSGFRPFR